MIEVRHSSSAAEIRALAAHGYEPIECSIGGASLVGELEMDHHGERSHLEGVAIRAYRDLFGRRRADPRFVVTGEPDEDATFAIAALAGLLPARERLDLLPLARLIDRADTDPIGLDLSAEPWGGHVLLFRALVTFRPVSEAMFTFGATLWNQVASCPSAIRDAARALERERRARARAAEVLLCEPPVKLVRADEWGFDVWYGRRPEQSAAEPAGWDSPVVLLFDRRDRSVTIGCPNAYVATALFGPGGLKTVFAELAPPGWGGRESIGGSPRGLELTDEQALAAARAVWESLHPTA